MPRCKVVFVGAGSYVFGPAPIRDLISRHKLQDLELVLVDPNPRMLDLMAGVAKAAAKQHHLNTIVRTETNAETALDGADFVICAVAIDQRSRFATDQQIIARYAPGHLTTEFGGIHGMSMSLRQIAMIRKLCDQMRSKCPDAWLLNVANPLPRVCQAATELGVKTAGFCSASVGSYSIIWEILHGKSLAFPFEPAISELKIEIAGLNHHTFMLQIRDATGRDLKQEIIQRIANGTTSGNPQAEQFLTDHGVMLAVNDGHTRDFFSPKTGQKPLDHISHGNADERNARMQLLKDIGEGKADPALCYEPQAWEYPGDFVAAVAYGKNLSFHSLNLPNTGQIPQLPHGAIVETAASAVNGIVSPQTSDLPANIVPYCLRTIAVTNAIVRAAIDRSRSGLRTAIELDPTILDKSAGKRAVDECLNAHEDLIGKFD